MKHLLICLILFNSTFLIAQSSNTKDNAIGIKIESISQPLIENERQTFIGIEYLRKITERTSLRGQLSLISESSLNISKGSIGLIYDFWQTSQFSTYGTLDYNVHQAFDENAFDQVIYSGSTGLGIRYSPTNRFSLFAEQKLVNIPFNSSQKIKLLDGTQLGLRFRF
jgi:hypothetical protein